ncbi:MAG: sel1 repeat family protein [Pedosphaera sp.]|nr:sel1 repeat family protein [Pedosphaera sp.]
MSVLLKILPLAAAAGVAVMNGDALKKSLDVVDKVRSAATSGVEMQGIAEALARDFVDDKNLPVEDFGGWLKENMRQKDGRETRDKSKDPWGTEYRLTVDVPKNGFSVLSAGPDTNWKSEDDLNYFYSLTGIEGKNAISTELAKRAQSQASKQGVSTAAGTSGSTKSSAPGTSSKKAVATSPPKPAQSAEERLSNNIEFRKKRAATGEAEASFDLAINYFTGEGVEKDYVEAKRLLEQAVKNASTETLREKAKIHLENLNKVLNK